MNANENYWNAQIETERLETALLTARERVRQCRTAMLKAATARLEQDRREMELSSQPLILNLYAKTFARAVRPE